MLNFIVLGIIPGTHLQISFSWLMLGVSIATAILSVLPEINRIRPARMQKDKANWIQQIAL